MIDILKGEINFLKSAWDLLGRPLVTLVLKRIHLGRSTERESRASFISLHVFILLFVFFFLLLIYFIMFIVRGFFFLMLHLPPPHTTVVLFAYLFCELLC